MAIFRMQIMPVRRREGRRAVSAAAYRAGERLRDESSGRLYNHERRKDVLHKEIVVPAAAGAPVWMRDRARLWNAAERAESGYHARPAREYQVALPAELGREAGVRLARTFAHRLSERYGVAIDLAVHAPKAGGDVRNLHAHLLSTTRLVTPGGLGAKTGLDLTARERAGRRLADHSREYRNVRALWSQLTNEALRSAGLAQRVDHRSLAEQGIDREPLPSLPIAAVYMERKGVRSRLADTLRRHYVERLGRRPERAVWRSVAQARARPAPAVPGGGASAAREAGRADILLQAAPRPGALAHILGPEIVLQRGPVHGDPPGMRPGPDGGDLRRTAEHVRQAAVESWRRQRSHADDAPLHAAGEHAPREHTLSGRRVQEDPLQLRREALQSWLRQRRQRAAEQELAAQRTPLAGLAPPPAWGLGL